MSFTEEAYARQSYFTLFCDLLFDDALGPSCLFDTIGC